eukprot:GHVL01001483.1.p1 GENE.GHVL01001483.1~~GHVL01001483.1.p1  ORF type:complete len:269 (-),score=54.49 GHVL01001483.1:130-936(-)
MSSSNNQIQQQAQQWANRPPAQNFSNFSDAFWSQQQQMTSPGVPAPYYTASSMAAAAAAGMFGPRPPFSGYPASFDTTPPSVGSATAFIPFRGRPAFASIAKDRGMISPHMNHNQQMMPPMSNVMAARMMSLPTKPATPTVHLMQVLVKSVAELRDPKEIPFDKFGHDNVDYYYSKGVLTYSIVFRLGRDEVPVRSLIETETGEIHILAPNLQAAHYTLKNARMLACLMKRKPGPVNEADESLQLICATGIFSLNYIYIYIYNFLKRF